MFYLAFDFPKQQKALRRVTELSARYKLKLYTRYILKIQLPNDTVYFYLPDLTQSRSMSQSVCHGKRTPVPIGCRKNQTIHVTEILLGDNGSPCLLRDCCPDNPYCEVSARIWKPSYYDAVISMCEGKERCTPDSGTAVQIDCRDNDFHSSDFTRINYQCVGEYSLCVKKKLQ